MTLSMRPTPELHQNPLRIAVGIATSGRAAILHEMLSELRSQTVPVFRIVISFDTQADIEGLSSGPDLLLLPGPKSLVEKRNRILDAVEDCDVVLFLDDDFLLAPTYVEATAASFTDENDIVVTTGRVIADGIIGPGLSVAAGRALLAQPSVHAGPAREAVPNGYGCNMAIRLSIVREHALRFDQRLPLYGWFEDLDFTRRVGRYGRVVKVNDACGVHLGTKTGRGSGLRLGYSQVVNPLYLMRKGSCPARKALPFVIRNCGMNLVRSFRPETYIDRRGRLRGNLIAVLHLLTGRAAPEHILTL